jgi:uncharacterized membrane protein
MKPTFSKIYFLATVIFLLIEICIALFIKDRFIRPFVGDVLVVVLIYCFVRTFLSVCYLKTAFGVFLFASLIETLQYFDYVKLLGLENNRILSIMMGRTFELTDYAAYFVGFLLIISIEKFYERHKTD